MFDLENIVRKFSRPGAVVPVLFAAVLGFAGVSRVASAQSVPAGDQGGVMVSAGAAGSGFIVGYGDRKMLGYSAFVDADTRRHLGIEAEGRWLEFHQVAQVHVETYSIGGRYHYSFGKFQVYGKGLIGFGNFNFPYNLATGRYMVVTAGGGLDYHLSKRIYARLADFEYQSWPQFTYDPPLSTYGLSVGLRVRVLGR